MFRRSVLLILALVAGTQEIFAKTSHFKSLGITIAVADSADGSALNSASDEYTRSLSPFDLTIRFGKNGLTEGDYLREAAKDTRNWTTESISKLQEVFGEIESAVEQHQIKLNLPDTIFIISTAGTTEFGAAGWTRSNKIMLNLADEKVSSHLVAHELFHVFSRNNPSVRDAIYEVFGFKPCNAIDYKTAVPHAITNPDCPVLEHYITVETEGRSVDGTLLLYSTKEYFPGFSLSEAAGVGLLVLQGPTSNKQPLIEEGRALMLALNDVPDLFRQISVNTQYILHPEEIAAEHFASLVTGSKLNQPEFGEKMLKVLQ